MFNKQLKAACLATMLLVIVGLAGCSSLFGGSSDYADDPLYATGYSDGCGTGSGFNPNDPSTLIRDPNGWSTSKAYRAGWKKGFNACKVSRGGQTGNLPDDAYGRRNGPSGY
ncbi:MAG: hypothetical protein WA138_01060 [Parvibaculum sp.]